ncbi:MAG: hypothetical protein GX339_04555 [Tissierellia bacterium]|nr:hypothetical protein [Tissierellia bacterium]
MALIIALSAHEVAHLFSAILLNIKFSKVKITLFGFNFDANLENVSYFKKILLFFSGPGCNLALYFGLRNTEYSYFANINLFLAYMNLVPIVPLDGGNICRTIMEFFLPVKTVSRYIVMTNIFFVICFIIIIHSYKNYLFFLLVVMGLKGIVEESRHILEKSISIRYNKIKYKG